MKTVVVITGYDEATRQLRSEVELTGFVSGLPDQKVGGVQLETVTMFEGAVMSAQDAQMVNASVARALNSANGELAKWKAAAENKDKSDLLPAPEAVV